MTSARTITRALCALAVVLAPLMAAAQGTNVAFAGLKTDITQPVQVDADQLAVDQKSGTATFSGNVVVAQGDMKLQAGSVVVTYSADKKSIQSLHADGGVTVAAGTDAATSQTADYSPDTGDLILSGHVVLTQGQTAISGETLTLSLQSGLGNMAGRVTTIFTPGKN
ncbi:MAG: lipopolysaccharide transport periplasmic protein LptA [bacterium]